MGLVADLLTLLGDGSFTKLNVDCNNKQFSDYKGDELHKALVEVFKLTGLQNTDNTANVKIISFYIQSLSE